MAVIRRLSSAKCCGVNVESIVQERIRLLKLEPVRASLPNVATALKAWHAFATGVLGVRSDSTLPPMSEDHVCTFASVFRSPKTAANCISYLRWTCVYLKISTKRHGPEIKHIVTGIRKSKLRFTDGPSRVESLLTSALIHKVVSTADALRIHNGFQGLCVIAWWFLLRVSNEGIPLQAGHITDSFELLAVRHSGVWIQNSKLHVRPRRRKNRPAGSLLSRPCLCKEFGPHLCPPHRLAPFLTQRSAGQPLFLLTTVTFTSTLRRLLSLSLVANSQTFTLKAFRAGRATEMAVQGDTLRAILLAGEWSSSAVLRYVNADAIDKQLFLQKAVVSDSDGECHRTTKFLLRRWGCACIDGCSNSAMVVSFFRHHDVADPLIYHVVARKESSPSS